MLQKSPESDLPNKGQTMPDDPVKCANFKYLISRWCGQTSVGGHHHRFTNPLGLSFHIRCFEFAPGTRFVVPRRRIIRGLQVMGGRLLIARLVIRTWGGTSQSQRTRLSFLG